MSTFKQLCYDGVKNFDVANWAFLIVCTAKRDGEWIENVVVYKTKTRKNAEKQLAKSIRNAQGFADYVRDYRIVELAPEA